MTWLQMLPLNFERVSRLFVRGDSIEYVFSSILCEVTPIIDLTEGGFVVTPIENERRAEILRKMAATIPAVGTNTLIVTHKPNIIDAFKKDWFDVKEGEASVFKPDGSGKALLIARIQSNEWILSTSSSVVPRNP